MESVTRFISQKLKLKVNSEKSAVARPEERKFLGFSFTRNRQPRRRIAPKAKVRFKQRVRELTWRTRGVSLEEMVRELASYLRGWRSYFGFCQTPWVLVHLDSWIRRAAAVGAVDAVEARSKTSGGAAATRGESCVGEENRLQQPRPVAA
jgi:RNA-directed DNA polymerase